MGIAPQDDVDAYLGRRGPRRDHPASTATGPVVPATGREPAPRPRRPTSRSGWPARPAPAPSQLDWTDPVRASWAVVVMNADGSPGVAADVSAGIGRRRGAARGLDPGRPRGRRHGRGRRPASCSAPWGWPIIDRPPPPPPPWLRRRWPARPRQAAHRRRAPSGSRPTLDPALSRWLWLVKWLLAIPHFVVLAFLWVAFVVLSVVAGFAILFTGRYPRGVRLQRRRAALDLAGQLLRRLRRRSAPTATRRSPSGRSPTTRPWTSPTPRACPGGWCW